VSGHEAYKVETGKSANEGVNEYITSEFEKFFTWLDKSGQEVARWESAKTKNSEAMELKKIPKVQYFTAEERKDCHVTINDTTGVLTWTYDESKAKREPLKPLCVVQPGGLAKDAELDFKFDLGKKELAFVLYKESGNNNLHLYAGKKDRGNVQHSSFMAGEDVLMAGYLHVAGGKIGQLIVASGHYCPDKEDADWFVNYYKKHFNSSPPDVDVVLKH